MKPKIKILRSKHDKILESLVEDLVYSLKIDTSVLTESLRITWVPINWELICIVEWCIYEP